MLRKGKKIAVEAALSVVRRRCQIIYGQC
ncbi:hypothetical protein NC652_031904 [Populus alba x Populus x berolinensis]|uniref:Uncharacterized protein n=1 Tax=Populus alba x Populus x berolinensis TaxID=444605 RepID=A0AAD6Q1T9_9ROSI|nr:hypothetical protein NC652_031904 [Populus alba x Populus x berolinensis]KAJ6975984.1 hypothetical protein NC653_031725 [Populus alba x Populus x berolinensis]